MSQRPQPPSSNSGSGSESDEASETGGSNDQAAMLAALEAHSRAIFGLDGPDEAESSAQAQRRASASSGGNEDEDQDDDGDEFQSDDGWGAEDGFVSDSEDELHEEMPSTGRSKRDSPVVRVEEVVFTPTGRRNLDVMSKSEKRAFLVGPIHSSFLDEDLLTPQSGTSAKMMGIKKEVEYAPGRKRPRTDAEDEDDQSVSPFTIPFTR